MGDLQTCAACRHTNHANEMYSRHLDGNTARYCRDHNACARREKHNRTQPKETHMFDEYTEPAQTEGDTYKPRENYGHHAIVKVLELKDSIVTANSPNGAPGIICNVHDLNSKTTHRDVLMMTGSLVDGFKPHVGGRPIVVQWAKRTANNGRDYATATPAVPAALEAAKALYALADPFAEEPQTITEQAPF